MSCSTIGPSGLGGRLDPTSGRSLGIGLPPSRMLASSHGVAAPPSARVTRWLLDPRWFAGGWPDSHSGGGTGLGAGGVAGCAALAAGEGLALTGITDPAWLSLLQAPASRSRRR